MPILNTQGDSDHIEDTAAGIEYSQLADESTLDVWDRATNQERQQLAPTMLRKMQAFRKTEYVKLMPVERERIDVRLAKAFHEMTNSAQAQQAGQ